MRKNGKLVGFHRNSGGANKCGEPNYMSKLKRHSILKSFLYATKFYLSNHCINKIPLYSLRHWYYRKVMKYNLGQDTSIAIGTFVTGNNITIGNNVVINRNCYLDGRIGILIGNNVSISPETYIVSMEHDPNDPKFSTRGGKVIIEDHVWIGARAIISPDVTIGEGAVIGAGAVVTRDIAAYKIAVGVPAKEINERNRDINYKLKYFPFYDTDIQPNHNGNTENNTDKFTILKNYSLKLYFKVRDSRWGKPILVIYRLTLKPIIHKVYRRHLIRRLHREYTEQLANEALSKASGKNTRRIKEKLLNRTEDFISLLKLLEINLEYPEAENLIHQNKNDYQMLKLFELVEHISELKKFTKFSKETMVLDLENLRHNPTPPPKKNILFITSQFPNSTHGGGLRVQNFIEILSESNNVSLFSGFQETEQEERDKLIPHLDHIKTLHHSSFIKDKISDAFLELTNPKFIHFEWVNSVNQLLHDYNRVTIFTYMEATSLRKKMDLDKYVTLSKEWKSDFWELIEALYLEVIKTKGMDILIVVTKKDGEFLSKFIPNKTLFILNHGINLDQYKLEEVEPEKNTLLFIGNYLHYPNEDAMRFFFGEIYDRVFEAIPDLKTYLVGANPTKLIKIYGKKRGVIVTGKVDEIQPYIQKASVCMAPLVSGAGLRTKVIQFAALNRTSVVTSIAANDMVFENEKDLFIVDDPNLFAEKLIYLLQNPMLAQEMGKSAKEKAFKFYDNRRLIDKLEQLYWIFEDKHLLSHHSQNYDQLDLIILDNVEHIDESQCAMWRSFSEGNRRCFHFCLPEAEHYSKSMWDTLIQKFDIHPGTCMVRDEGWLKKASYLAKNYGAKIILDKDIFLDFPIKNETFLSLSFSEAIANPSTFWKTLNDQYEKATIILLSYNNLELIQECVESILERTIYPNFEILIVDNNSSDKQVIYYLKEMERKFPEIIRVILNNENVGFAKGNNIGLKEATNSEYYVLINNDIVVTKGWLSRLIAHLNDKNIGIVGPVTNMIGNEARITVPYINTIDMPKFAKDYSCQHLGEIFDIRVAAMFCVAFRDNILNKVGYLDEVFELGMFEDEDFSMRVRAAGLRVVCAEDVFIHHYGSSSFSKLNNEVYNNLFQRNKKIFEEKWQISWMPYKDRETL